MDTINEVVNSWLKHRMVTQELLDLVDEEDVSFTPWEGAYDLGGLAVHMATSMDMFAQLIMSGKFSQPKQPSYESIQDVREIMNAYTRKTKKDLKDLTQTKLSAEIEFNREKAPGSFWLSNAIDHEIHHKGQLFTYVRMTGAENVPFFMKHPNQL